MLLQPCVVKKMIVVTGASGHISGNLVRALLDGDRPVRAMVFRDTRALDGLPVDLVEADLLDRESLVRAFHGADLIYHLAARISIAGDDGGMVPRVNRRVEWGKAARELGHTVRPVRETVEDVYNWFESHGMLER